jgi:hypothetical protein
VDIKMDFSFCIITDGSEIAKERIKETIKSIEDLNIPNYEILCIGGDSLFEDIENKNFKKYTFDEKIKNIWITKKKNDIAKVSKYENLVIFHDYYIFDKNWYDGLNLIKKDFEECDICVNPIYLINGNRDYVDWITWDHPIYGKQKSINYDNKSMTNYQYISGGYFIVKKNFFLKNKLNEDLNAGQEEDVEWSLRVRACSKIIFNKNSSVRHNKIHRHVNVIPEIVG